MRRHAICLTLLLLIGPAVSVTFAQGADTDAVILANGNILTMNPDQPTASTMAVRAGRIIEVGDLAAVKKVVGKSYEYIDLEGKTVVPGFIETHDHIMMYGSVLTFLDVSPFVTPSLKEALHRMKTQGKPDESGWVYAFGADQTLYTEKRGPTRQELDELFPDQPAFIIHLSGHGAYANSRAFEAAGWRRASSPSCSREKPSWKEATAHVSWLKKD